MPIFRKTSLLKSALALGLLGGIVALVAMRLLKPPSQLPPNPDRTLTIEEFLKGVPEPEVRAFLGRVLTRVPPSGERLAGYQFAYWAQEGKLTQEVVGLKAIPSATPATLIPRILDVDRYQGNIAHVGACQSKQDSRFKLPKQVRFHQKISVPVVGTIQHELVLVDAGTVRGFRVLYWYLLEDETKQLSRKNGARSAFNVGAWLVAPGKVGYALSSWPQRDDVNGYQWFTLTNIADAAARKVVEGNIDGMVAWAMKPEGSSAGVH